MSVNWKSLVETKLKEYENTIIGNVKEALSNLSEDYIVKLLTKKKQNIELCNLTIGKADDNLIFDLSFGSYEYSLPELKREKILDIVMETIKEIIAVKKWDFEVVLQRCIGIDRIFLNLTSAYD